jgi:glycine/D-amino acid oxidase-like deaminating enzyme
VPLGDDCYKVGATYDWDTLDANPTSPGRAFLESIARDIGGPEFRVVAHEAGIRPILRKSQPVIGPMADGSVVFNGLGSKGALCAPLISNRLADWLIDGREIEEELSTQAYFANLTKL